MSVFWKRLADGWISLLCAVILCVQFSCHNYLAHRGLISLIALLTNLTLLILGIWASAWTLACVIERKVPWTRCLFVIPFTILLILAFR